MQIEYRTSPLLAPRIEYRGDKGDQPVIVGYAAVFGRLSYPLHTGGRSFRELILPGAFDATLRDKDYVVGRYEHRDELGNNRAGTLRLNVTNRGLRYEIDAPNSALGRKVVEEIRSGRVRSSSFAFTVRPGGDRFEQQSGDWVIRTLSNLTLHDVSPVRSPAYPGTDSSLFESLPLDLYRKRLKLAEMSS